MCQVDQRIAAGIRFVCVLDGDEPAVARFDARAVAAMHCG
jgi:hypothetical protein